MLGHYSRLPDALTGQVAPAQDGVLSGELFLPQINDAGQVAFLGSVSGATNYRAIFRGEGAGLTEIVREGHMAPDGNGTFGTSGEGDVFDRTLTLNNQGHIAFGSKLLNTVGGSSDNRGIFVFDGTNVVQVARTGQPLAGSTVLSLTFSTSLQSPNNSGLNDQMQVAYQAHLADGRDVVARFEPIMYWHNLGSGNWGTFANWSLGVEPTNPYDVFIVAENALTVAGPTVNRTVKSLTIGGADTANATLSLVSGVTLTATNGTTILPNGILNVPTGANLAGALVNNGTLNGPTAAGQFLDFNNPVSGSGIFNGNMRFIDAISPGNSPGLLNVVGDVALGTAATYNVELGGVTLGSQYDSLGATGQMSLAGTLSMSLLDGFVPSLNDIFTVLTFGSRSGDFTSYLGLNVGGHLALRHVFTANSLILTARPAVDGDINLDGTVNIFDINSVSSNWSTTGPQGDANGDGIVNIFDINLISSNWGATGAAAVPEPATLILALCGLVGVVSLRGRRR